MFNDQKEIPNSCGVAPAATPPAVEVFLGSPDVAGQVQLIETPVLPSAGAYPGDNNPFNNKPVQYLIS